jgi:hypothetical protein
MSAAEESGDGKKPFLFGISGHRDLVPATLPALRASLETLFRSFCKAYPDRCFQLLSPLAEGADRVGAEVALAHGIKLLVPMPMDQAEYERDFVAPGSLAEFRRLLAAAESHWKVGGEEHAGETDSAGGEVRARCYAAVGDYLARESEVLILLWDGRHNEKLGGTGWVKKRREFWLAVGKKEGSDPGSPAYSRTIQVVTPRLSAREQPPVTIVGALPVVP